MADLVVAIEVAANRQVTIAHPLDRGDRLVQRADDPVPQQQVGTDADHEHAEQDRRGDRHHLCPECRASGVVHGHTDVDDQVARRAGLAACGRRPKAPRVMCDALRLAFLDPGDDSVGGARQAFVQGPAIDIARSKLVRGSCLVERVDSQVGIGQAGSLRLSQPMCRLRGGRLVSEQGDDGDRDAFGLVGGGPFNRPIVHSRQRRQADDDHDERDREYRRHQPDGDSIPVFVHFSTRARLGWPGVAGRPNRGIPRGRARPTRAP
ncbi:MAG: hypothetical protein R3E87_26415 [Burkholderiaceae bacterium]